MYSQSFLSQALSAESVHASLAKSPTSPRTIPSLCPSESLHCSFSIFSPTPMPQSPRAFHMKQDHIPGFSEHGLGKAWVETGTPRTGCRPSPNFTYFTFPKYSYILCLLFQLRVWRLYPKIVPRPETSWTISTPDARPFTLYKPLSFQYSHLNTAGKGRCARKDCEFPSVLLLAFSSHESDFCILRRPQASCILSRSGFSTHRTLIVFCPP